MDLSAITQPSIATVSELIDLAESFGGLENRWAFRGQPRDYGTLVPSFQREFSRQSHGTAEIVERSMLEHFRKHFETLQDRSAYMPMPAQIAPGYDLRCLSVMQHYEIPTRLLDWTSEFWTAIYFACASQPGQKAELWCYNRAIFDGQRAADPALQSLLSHAQQPPAEPVLLGLRGEVRIIELDPLMTRRMTNQSAHHTFSTDVFADHGPLLYEQQKAATPPGQPLSSMQRVILDAACKGKALQYLADHKQITASTVFPDVVGLGRYLRWQFESLRTMLL